MEGTKAPSEWRKSEAPERREEGIWGECALPRIWGPGAPENLGNFTYKSVHFGAFWRRLSNIFLWGKILSHLYFPFVTTARPLTPAVDAACALTRRQQFSA